MSYQRWLIIFIIYCKRDILRLVLKMVRKLKYKVNSIKNIIAKVDNYEDKEELGNTK